MTMAAFEQKYTDPRSTEELIRLALSERDEDLVGELVSALHYRGSHEVLEACERLCASVHAPERELGATILGQLGVPSRSFPEECFLILERMARAETDADTLQAIAVSFGHLHDARCIPLLLPLRNHASEIVRWGVVHGLSGHNDSAAIDALIELSSDEDEEIRDWATFGLGSLLEADSEKVREALWARVEDPCDDARAEALVGLARRKDPRIADLLEQQLSGNEVNIMAIDAAEELADPRLVPALLNLKERWPADRAEDEQWLDRAIGSCLGDSGAMRL